MPDGRTLLRCFLRTYLVGAAFNTRGLQNVGIAYAMEPGLKAIYPDLKKRRIARKRYLRHYNTHPFWTPLLVGTFLSLETLIARGKAPPEMLTALKDTTTYTLSAIGDSVFGGSFLVFWSLVTSCLLVAGMPIIALCWSLALFLALQGFKLFTFIAGLRGGLKVLTMLRNWDLINWGERLKLANAVVLVLLLYLIWPGGHEHTAIPTWVEQIATWSQNGQALPPSGQIGKTESRLPLPTGTLWATASLMLCLVGWLIGRFHLSRIVLLFILSLAAVAMPLLTHLLPAGW